MPRNGKAIPKRHYEASNCVCCPRNSCQSAAFCIYTEAGVKLLEIVGYRITIKRFRNSQYGICTSFSCIPLTINQVKF